MISLKNTFVVGLIAGSSFLAPGVAQAQTMTKQEICESFKQCAHNGCKFLSDYVPGFEMFFRQFSLTSEEKLSVDKKFCSITELDYIANDRLIAALMQDNSLTLAQKKSLVLHFFLKNPIDPSLEQHRKKYEQFLLDSYVWTMANDDAMVEYLDKTLAKSKEMLAKSEEDLAKSEENLEKTKKTGELYKEIEKIENLVRMLENK